MKKSKFMNNAAWAATIGITAASAYEASVMFNTWIAGGVATAIFVAAGALKTEIPKVFADDDVSDDWKDRFKTIIGALFIIESAMLSLSLSNGMISYNAVAQDKLNQKYIQNTREAATTDAVNLALKCQKANKDNLPDECKDNTAKTLAKALVKDNKVAPEATDNEQLSISQYRTWQTLGALVTGKAKFTDPNFISIIIGFICGFTFVGIEFYAWLMVGFLENQERKKRKKQEPINDKIIDAQFQDVPPTPLLTDQRGVDVGGGQALLLQELQSLKGQLVTIQKHQASQATPEKVAQASKRPSVQATGYKASYAPKHQATNVISMRPDASDVKKNSQK